MASKRKLNEISTSSSSDDANGRRGHLEAQTLNQRKHRERLGLGKNPGLNLYIWQDPHQPREVVSDGEDDEWMGPPGSLLGSDILARVSHNPEFASAARESRQELETVTAKGPKRVEPIIQRSIWALARTHKYGQRRMTTKIQQSSSYANVDLTRLNQELARQYSTDHYTRFDLNKTYHVQAVTIQYPINNSSIYHFKGYHLCMDPTITSALEIPQLPVRLDDRLVALAYEEFAAGDRYRLWPSEFTANGMLRAGRIPLGFAAKHEYKVGDVDYDGNVLQPGEEGWYYLWLGGVHCLMGKEGMDAGRFQLRDPNCPRITGFAFRKSHRAEIQAPPGVESERCGVVQLLANLPD